jgi:antitoxin ParD1/3/4
MAKNANLCCLYHRYRNMTINVSLTPQLEELVREKVSSGRYNSVSEVVREALRLMDTYEGLRLTALAKLRADVEAGWQQVEEGKVKDFDSATVKRRGREKLARIKNAKQ